MKFNSKYISPNYNNRNKGKSICFIIIHYTALKSELESIRYLCDKKNKVSSHFLITKAGKIFNLVPLKYRAWHAGYSKWKNYKDINSYSIGIELDNPGYCKNSENFKKKQILALIELITHLKIKYKIKNCNILGHSDIAPYRKIDPGEKFPWKYLAKLGVGYYPKKLNKLNNEKIENKINFKSLKIRKFKALYMLSKIGYDTSLAYSKNYNYRQLIKIYQMHFNNRFVSGKLDESTYFKILNHYNDILTIK